MMCVLASLMGKKEGSTITNDKNSDGNTVAVLQLQYLCSFLSAFRWTDDSAEYHQREPDEDQIFPTDLCNSIGEEGGGYRCSHVAHKVQKAGSGGYHTGIAETWAVTAPKHTGCTVGGHNGQHQ